MKGIRRLNVWLRQRCRRLSTRQQSLIVYVLCGVYLLLSLYMLAQPFISRCVRQEETPVIIEGQELLIDSPIEVERETVRADGLLTENTIEEINDSSYGEE